MALKRDQVCYQVYFYSAAQAEGYPTRYPVLVKVFFKISFSVFVSAVQRDVDVKQGHSCIGTDFNITWLLQQYLHGPVSLHTSVRHNTTRRKQ